jgi:hypothetical protein
MATAQTIKVTLQRDSLQTPWGFRLQGGADFRTPFSVNKVTNKRKYYFKNENFFIYIHRLVLVVQLMDIFIVVMLFLKSMKNLLVQYFMLMH